MCVCVYVFTFVSVSLAACTHSLYWTAAAAAEQPKQLDLSAIENRNRRRHNITRTLAQSNANKLTHTHIHSHTVSTGRRCRRTAGDFGGRTGPGRSRTKIYALGMRTDKRRARARDPLRTLLFTMPCNAQGAAGRGARGTRGEAQTGRVDTHTQHARLQRREIHGELTRLRRASMWKTAVRLTGWLA